MKKISILLSFVLFLSLFVNAQSNDDMFVKRGYIIISASENYKSIKKLAEQASQKLNYKLDLRGLEPNDEIGLSFSKEICEQEDVDFPSYYQRGRADERKFVSVEYTDVYKGFTKGLYIIIVADYDKKDPKLKKTLAEVKKHYKNAYIKYADLYMGCMH